ncbi:hypothetical protein [Herbaspirillum huttiense]|uniref:Uncharacterized protein n=2 Tax=Herbaspirillum huttiense TaxID=863372 RepID=A0AAJ2HD76_9BURK|nr:hypothetical protein [Herbaspirillum huttiense]MDR9838377.1 hypothetical protein [Herbaspirillum huttiense]
MKFLLLVFWVSIAGICGTALAEGKLQEGYSAWHNEDPCDAGCQEGDRPVTHLIRDLWLYRRGNQFCGLVLVVYAPRGKIASGRIRGHATKDRRFLFNYTDDWSRDDQLGLAESKFDGHRLQVNVLEGTSGYMDFDSLMNSFKKTHDEAIFRSDSIMGIRASFMSEIYRSAD